MPIGFTSAARNLFLLGSAGADLVTNFFKTIDQSSTTDGVFTARDIKYLYSEERYLLAGLALNSQGKSFGFHEKRQEDGTEDWSVKTQSTDPTNNVTLTSLELDSNGNLLVGGLANNAPWIARYTNAGVLQWTSTTNTGNGRYFGLAVDSDDNYYGAGRTKRNNPLITDDGFRSSAILEKYDNNGNTVWGKSVSVTGENVCFNKVDATSTSIIAAGYLSDGIGKGYLAKFDKSNGEMQWDRTIVSNVKTDLGIQEQTSIEDIDVDPDGNIYLCGTLFLADSEDDTEKKGRGFVIKYSAEGNLLWQKEVGVPGFLAYYQYYNISVDDNTRQVVVFGRTYNASATYGAGLLTKLSASGQILWNRRLLSDRVPPTLNHFSRRSGFDADPSFYYVFFTDDNTNLLSGTPDEYTFGRVSSSGNGLGDFQYEPQTGINIDYEIINPQTRIGKLQDGSIRNDSSDLTSYPFSALKVSFDDYATPITNKKAILSDKDLVQRSGSPAIRPVDFMELDLGDESFDVFVPAQEELYDQIGTYSFEVPAGVTEVSAVAIGGGGGAAFCTGSNASSAGGGGGGGTAWGTFTVTPGETLTVVVGDGGAGGQSAGAIPGTSGGDSTISRGGTALLNGGGGAGGVADAPATNSSFGTAAAGGTSTGSERDGGGAGGLGGPPRYNFGGGGGGGAAGYNGDGGNGGSGNSSGTTPQGGQGVGGGAGGGGGQGTGGVQNNGGGGLGIYGGPINGAGGAIDSPAGGGSNGQGGQPGGDGGLFGGGGGGREDDTSGAGGSGGSGGVRIIWGAGRSFPDNAQRDFSSTETKVTDKSGNGNIGTVNGATLNAGGYWEFDGTDDKINVNDLRVEELGETFTVEAWIYPTDFAAPSGSPGDAYPRRIMSCHQSNASTKWCLGIDTSGRLGFGGSQGVEEPVGNKYQLSLNTYYHVMLVHDGTEYTLYVDGVERANNTSSPISTSNSTQDPFLCIGGRPNQSDRVFQGRIGDVRAYLRPLTAAQVFQNYNATKTKYINEAPDTAPKIGPGIVTDSNSLLNYDFGNRATYDPAENIVPNSQNKTGWNQVRGTITDVDIVAPDGTSGAFLYTEGTQTGPHHFKIPYNTGGSDYGDEITWSSQLYFKRYGSKNRIRFGLNTKDDTYRHLLFDFNTGQVETEINITGTYSVDNVGGGWYRLNLTDNGDTGSTRPHAVMSCFMIQNDTASTSSYTGDGESGVYFWGPNLKIGSTGRYIKTYGTAITAPTTVKNLSSNSFPGTINGATFNLDKFDFDGTNDSITVAGNISTIGTGDFAIECWIYLPNVTPTSCWRGIVTIGNGYTTTGGITLYAPRATTPANTVVAILNAVNPTIGGTSNVNDSTWHHVVLTRVSSTLDIYVDGTSEASQSNTANITQTAVTIGRDLDCGTTYYQGSIRELRIYNRGLLQAEVSQNFNATRAKYGV